MTEDYHPTTEMSSMEYTRLSQNEESDLALTKLEDDRLFTHPRKRRFFDTRKCVYCFLIVLGGLLCATIGYTARTAGLHMSHTPTRLECGNSAAEAQANGCVFDLLTNNWMPSYCADRQTDAEYRAWVSTSDRDLGSFAFFHDNNAEHRVSSVDELSNLIGTRIYTTTENHLAHCAFLARRMHRLVTGEIAAVADNPFSHTMHCSKAVINAIGSGEHGGKARIGSSFHPGIVSCLV